MSQRIMMPLLNNKVAIFEGPIWYLDDGICLETVYDEDFGAFHRDELDDYYKSSININTICVYIIKPNFENFDDFSRKMATQLKFVLNNFSNGNPIVLPYSALLNITNKAQVTKIINIEAVANLHEFRRQIYSIKPNIERETVSNYFKLVNKCCNSNPTLLFTLDKFNSCLMRHEWHDKIVDITISLESLISGNQELRYKFALFNSFLAEESSDKRLAAFELFTNLYDARSGIVHGDISSKDKTKPLTSVKNNWSIILRLAKASINYYLFFLYQKSKAEWDLHLKNLIFGIDPRIVD